MQKFILARNCFDTNASFAEYREFFICQILVELATEYFNKHK